MKAKRVQTNKPVKNIPMDPQKVKVNGYKIVEKKGGCMCGKIKKSD